MRKGACAAFGTAHRRLWKEQTKFRQVEFDTDTRTHTQTRLRMCSLTQSLGFQQTSSGWNDESLVRYICFPSHYWREEGGGGGTEGGLLVAERARGGRGELLICPMQCQHLTNFMQPFKWLPPLAHLCFLATPHWVRSQRNRSMQMSYRPLKRGIWL